jgi:hypothetical protein
MPPFVQAVMEQVQQHVMQHHHVNQGDQQFHVMQVCVCVRCAVLELLARRAARACLVGFCQVAAAGRAVHAGVLIGACLVAVLPPRSPLPLTHTQFAIDLPPGMAVGGGPPPGFAQFMQHVMGGMADPGLVFGMDDDDDDDDDDDEEEEEEEGSDDDQEAVVFPGVWGDFAEDELAGMTSSDDEMLDVEEEWEEAEAQDEGAPTPLPVRRCCMAREALARGGRQAGASVWRQAQG